MCQVSFGGRSDEYIVWLYGDDSVKRFNGAVVLGNKISPYCVKEKNGLRFTDLSRTLHDALSNEPILDMQGITEAISRYYYSHNESFDGLFIAPEFQDRFEELAADAIDYYNDQEEAMYITAEEKLMYEVMRAVFECGIPGSFKGSMVLKACLIEAGYDEDTRHTVDIDGNWISDTPPSTEQMVESLQKALDRSDVDLNVNLYRMY